MTALLDRLEAEHDELRFAAFTLDDAWRLGSRLRTIAAERGLPIAIAIWFGPQRVFHAALPGASADNDGWLDRKHRVVERYGKSSLLVGEEFRAKGEDFDTHARLDPQLFAAHGGVLPLRLVSGAVIGAVGVSGLPQLDDHELVVAQLRAMLGEARER
ncbi:heme-degrading domain-containing protein [Agromyces sp. H3Y2-19a]|uniref:heme-degrading domain-containing protein n=1 Tax=Agromyces TaxID=33877 RepID=UPI001E3B6C47|nr:MULTISPECIES: heme-degrading domain-containing protein [Agromyces]MCD5345633.1 heme-degrading domain-containing protein [Agromyces sp. S2-1-8]MDF0511999.1 heme-degrading domain-containing protein [Agromyces chromiiresistens]